MKPDRDAGGHDRPTRAEAEFTEWVSHSYPGLLRTSYLLTTDRGLAEDLVQTVLTKLFLRWDRLHTVRQDGALDAYARTALTRQAISWWRRPAHRERAADRLPDRADHRDAFDALDEREALLAGLAGLPRRQRAAVVLRHLDDLSEADTAAVMGCSIGAVKSHTHRGLAALRVRLESSDHVRLTPRSNR